MSYLIAAMDYVLAGLMLWLVAGPVVALVFDAMASENEDDR